MYKRPMNLRNLHLVDMRHHPVDTRMLEDNQYPVRSVHQTRSTHENQQLHMRMYKQTMYLCNLHLVDMRHHPVDTRMVGDNQYPVRSEQ